MKKQSRSSQLQGNKIVQPTANRLADLWIVRERVVDFVFSILNGEDPHQASIRLGLSPLAALKIRSEISVKAIIAEYHQNIAMSDDEISARMSAILQVDGQV